MNPEILNFKGTCSVVNPKNEHATFARSRKYLKLLDGTELNLVVFVPKGIDTSGIDLGNVKFAESDWFEYEFALLHNAINKGKFPVKSINESLGPKIHKTFHICDGIREVNAPDGSKVHFKHMGNVRIGKNVRIGPFSVLERAIFDSTIIENGVRIDMHCAIGHNSMIGENTVIASGVGVGGSAIIGKNCWIGGNSYIRNGVKVCDGTVVGCMSSVVKDIIEPGIYAGVPAKFIKPVSEGWNF